MKKDTGGGIIVRGTLAVLLVAGALLSSGCSVFGDFSLTNYKGTWEQEFEFTGEEISAQGVNGTITVDVWEQPKLKVVADWSARVPNYQFNPRLEQSESSFSILSDTGDRNLSGTSYTLFVPQNTDLVLRTSNGGISVSGAMLADLDVKTSNGAVMVENAGDGLLQIETSNGLARVSHWQGEITCTTSNGGITAILGQITQGDYTFTTSNGGISVSVHPDSRFHLIASTSNGNIRTTLPGQWTPQLEDTSYVGNYNGGGASFILRSSNSSIQVLERVQ